MMTASPTAPADVGRTVLARAARHVSETFRNDAGDALDQDEVHAVVGDLVRRIEAAREGTDSADGRDHRSVSALGRRLLELIRAAVIERCDDVEDSTRCVMTTLRAVETVRAQIEPDWSGYFSSRLSGPGALDLVVEVAHDLRSPLTSILFLAETMIRGQSGAVTPVQRRQLGLVYGAALGLSSVASDVIELARGGDRLVEREPGAFSIAEIFESVCSIIQPIAEEKGLDVRTVLPAGEHRIGHRVALSRVLLNLTTNALRFTDEGFVEIAATASGPNNLEFSVRDTGRGITTDALTTLYQPFQRTRSRREYAFSGTGLGLTICSKLVRAMRSELRVETRPSWGTRFYFELDLPTVSPIED